MFGLVLLGSAAALVLKAFNNNLVFFFSPSQVASKEAPINRSFRLGGLVENGSLKRDPEGLTVHFVVTDLARNIPVTYTGLLPDLFKEGKGVLAKHDENYMPPEAADALKKAREGILPPPANSTGTVAAR